MLGKSTTYSLNWWWKNADLPWWHPLKKSPPKKQLKNKSKLSLLFGQAQTHPPFLKGSNMDSNATKRCLDLPRLVGAKEAQNVFKTPGKWMLLALIKKASWGGHQISVGWWFLFYMVWSSYGWWYWKNDIYIYILVGDMVIQSLLQVVLESFMVQKKTFSQGVWTTRATRD